MPFKVVATCNIPFVLNPRGMEGVAGVEYALSVCHTEDEIIAAARDADAVVIGHEPYTAKAIAGLRNCRLMVTPKTGYDNIDVAAATKAGICVSNVSGASSEEASDHAMALLLTCARKLFREDKAVRAGMWRSIHGPEMEAIWRGISQLRGQTLGLIGFGKIPRTLVPKAKGFGLKVLVYDPFVSDTMIEEAGVERATLGRLLAESDYVSVHSALTSENVHMLGAEQFQLMKPTAYVINTARGPLIDEKALREVLVQGRLAGAALDVLEVEPARMDNPLLSLDNVIVTGHSAHYSDLAISIIRSRAREDVQRLLRGEWPVSWINPEAREAHLRRWGRR